MNRRHSFSAEKTALIDEEIASMISKNAIEEIPPSPSFLSNLFIVPKKDGGNRPIINLKPLNRQYLSPPHFKMDTVRDVASLLRPGDWGATLDLKDAYFHIPIHPPHRRYLRFIWKAKLYQFLVLAFGLCTAPFIFTKLTRPIAAFLRAQGIRVIFYLDDILILGSTLEECRLFVQIAIDTLQQAGFLLNWKKSSLEPSQRFLFLGLWWDCQGLRVQLEERKLSALQSQASLLLSHQSPTCRSLMKLLGLMTAAIPAVPLIRLHCRPLQMCLNRFYKTSSDLLLRLILCEDAKREIHWVMNLTMDRCKAPIWSPALEDADLRVATDSSDNGWGLFFEGQMESGRWGVLAPLHINVKETMTLLIFLRDFLPSVQRPVKVILWETDSTTALAYIAKEGGTQSLPLLEVATKILLLAAEMKVSILPVYVPSEENLHADFASRFKEMPDLHLRRQTFLDICRLWGSPEIDLFASPKSAQLPRFLAWGEAPSAEAFDALSLPWNFSLAYAFPPIPLVPRVIKKIRLSTGVIILITPFWTAQTWFPALLSLRVQEVRRLPYHPQLVIDLTIGSPPPLLDSLHLVAWKIIGGRTISTMSQIKPSASLVQDGENRLEIDTTEHGNLSPNISIPTTFQSLQSL